MNKTAVELGLEGEKLFRAQLDKIGQPYIYIDQEKNSYSNFFGSKANNKAKRPDYILSIKGFGSIAVDCKHQKIYQDKSKLGRYFTINSAEFFRAREFSYLFGLPWWWVFKNNEEHNGDWYWLNLRDISLDEFHHGNELLKINIHKLILISQTEFEEASCFSKIFSG